MVRLWVGVKEPVGAGTRVQAVNITPAHARTQPATTTLQYKTQAGVQQFCFHFVAIFSDKTHPELSPFYHVIYL